MSDSKGKERTGLSDSKRKDRTGFSDRKGEMSTSFPAKEKKRGPFSCLSEEGEEKGEGKLRQVSVREGEGRHPNSEEKVRTYFLTVRRR